MPRDRLIRSTLAVVVSAMSLTAAAACGSTDAPTVEAAPTAEVAGGAPSQTLVGTTGLLVIDLETRRAVQLTPGTDGLRTQAESSLGGEDAIVNVSGVQLVDGSWAVVGNDCDSAEIVDPAACDPGTATVAIVDAEGTRTIEGLPDEFTHSFVTVRGSSSSKVLLETWDAGASSYWTLDPEADTFTEISWRPRPLPVRDQILTDADLDELQPVRTSCILEDEILVVDGLPNGPALDATATLVSTTTGRPVIDGMALDLGRDVVLDNLLCAPGTAPRLVAVDHATNRPLTYDLAIGSRIDAVSPTAAPPTPGPLVDITYGPSSVAIQYTTAPLEVTLDEPTSPDAPGTVTSTAEVGVVMFDSDRWRSVVDPSDRSIRLGERVYPLPESRTPLVVHSVQSGEYRAAE